MFMFGARNFHSRRTRNEKPVLENGVYLCRRFLERVAYALDYYAYNEVSIAVILTANSLIREISVHTTTELFTSTFPSPLCSKYVRKKGISIAHRESLGVGCRKYAAFDYLLFHCSGDLPRYPRKYCSCQLVFQRNTLTRKCQIIPVWNRRSSDIMDFV